MMDAFRPPALLKFFIGNVKENWRKWRQELENYVLATEKDERADKIKIAILLNLLGRKGLEIFNTFKFEPPECLGLENAIETVRAAETSRDQLRSMKENTAATVNSAKRNRRQNKPKESSQEYECRKCGRKHKPCECPAYGKVCTKCNKKTHFAATCFQNSKNIHEIYAPENELGIYIDSVAKKVQENELNSDSMNKNVEMVSETWYKSATLNVNDKYFELILNLILVLK
ncbi:hypothetical protein AVEN_275117-1 [Araneus ventricosus]|uniref:CCHC-type domain-containing protein n=1 Tax=Araneus ventricosus TaxID=182803 RepID=A0A4Y2P8A1_ARAVE|nr:hypothetical protein AVEN_275117-1 [Araneus ventricosus]